VINRKFSEKAKKNKIINFQTKDLKEFCRKLAKTQR